MTQVEIQRADSETFQRVPLRSSAASHRVRWLLCLVLTVFLLYPNFRWHFEMEAIRYTFPSLMAPFYSVIFNLLMLIAVNSLLEKWTPRIAFSPQELIVLYILLTIGLLFMSYDMFLPLVSIIAHANWFASPENQWGKLFLPNLPHHLTVSDYDSLRNFYIGSSSLFDNANFINWLTPCLCWMSFTLALILTCHCINLMLRVQWMERERLTFPIIELPYIITHETGTFFRNRLMWIGFGIAFGIGLLNGLNVLDPRVPSIPNRYVNLEPFLLTRPWSALVRPTDDIAIRIYPWAVGLGFIMPLDVLASTLFFYFLHKGSMLLGGITGWDQIKDYPYRFQQSIGANTALVALVLWYARKHLFNIVLIASGKSRPLDAEKALISNADRTGYRLALAGALAGFMFMVWFASYGGMSVGMVVAFLIAHIVMALSLTRMRAELGLPIHSTTFTGPHHSLTTLIGTRNISPVDLTWFGIFFWFNRDNRSHPMPHQMEALKLAQRCGIDPRKLTLSMFAIVLVAMPMCLWILLDQFFHLGVNSGKVGLQINSFGGRGYGFVEQWISQPKGPDSPGIAAIGFGFLLTMSLAALRINFPWWPIHPFGYAIASHIDLFWAAWLISYAFKWCLIRYGGIQALRNATPLFLGLVLGDFTIGSLWNFVSIALGPGQSIYAIYY